MEPVESQEESNVLPQKDGVPEANAEVLLNTVRAGANWFYWIAGLSIVNSLGALMSDEPGGGFVIGLGVTQVIDAIAYTLTSGVEASEGVEAIEGLEGGAATMVLAIAFGFSAGISIVFALVGWLAKQRYGWAFVLGMVFYTMDALLLLLFGDIFGLAFHGLALSCIFMGYRALGKL